MCNRDWTLKVFVAICGVFTYTASALAGGGNVLPPDAQVKGYSLSDAAAATADFNTGGGPANVPFVVLNSDATVKPGTMLYVPVFFSDDSPPVPPGFPTDVGDQRVDADFLLGLVNTLFGVEDFLVEVDDETTVLSADYISGVKTAPLPDGGGTQYIVSAAFLTPLTPGQHKVGIGGIIDDEPVVFVSYDVTVK
jgi:hypothetical protein